MISSSFPIISWSASVGRSPTRGAGARIISRPSSAPSCMRRATRVGDLWHIVAAGLPLDFAAPQSGESGPALAARARAQGAFVAIAHPAWSQLTIEDGRALASAHAVEIYNHGCAVENDRGDGTYLMDQLLNEGCRLTAIATDDAHFRHGDYDAFGGFVEVKAESLDAGGAARSAEGRKFLLQPGPAHPRSVLQRRRILDRLFARAGDHPVSGTSRALVKVGRQITGATFGLTNVGKTIPPGPRRRPGFAPRSSTPRAGGPGPIQSGWPIWGEARRCSRAGENRQRPHWRRRGAH